MHTHNVCNICIGEQSLIYHVPGIIGTHCQVISFGPYLEKITSILSTLISQIVSTMSGYSFWALSGGRLRLCQTQLCPTLRASTCRLSHDDNKGKWLDKNDDKIGIAYFFIDFLSHFNLFRFFLCAFWFQLFCSFNWFGCCAESKKATKTSRSLKVNNVLFCFSSIAFTTFYVSSKIYFIDAYFISYKSKKR